MSNFETVWGNTPKDWCPVDVKAKQMQSAFTAIAWVGMVAFFVSVALAVETKSTVWSTAALISLFVWVGGGIVAIRIIRAQRKTVIIPR